MFQIRGVQGGLAGDDDGDGQRCGGVHTGDSVRTSSGGFLE